MDKLDWHGLKVTPYDDIIDTRNVLERIEELDSENVDDEGEEVPRSRWTDSDRSEYVTLSELVEEIGKDAGTDGVTLIREAHFTEYIRDLYADCGSNFKEYNPHTFRDEDVTWDDLMSRSPFKHIDWDAVAEDERSDYSIVEFLGTTYYYLGA